jgi:hypothetical protein
MDMESWYHRSYPTLVDWTRSRPFNNVFCYRTRSPAQFISKGRYFDIILWTKHLQELHRSHRHSLANWYINTSRCEDKSYVWKTIYLSLTTGDLISIIHVLMFPICEITDNGFFEISLWNPYVCYLKFEILNTSIMTNILSDSFCIL